MSRAATVVLTPMSPVRQSPHLRVVVPPDAVVASSTAVSCVAAAESGDGKLVLTPELQAEIEQASLQLELAEPEDILRWATQRFAPKFTMATAFGPEGMVLIHMLAEIAPQTPIFNLDTGYQFKETLELREEVKRRYGIAVEMKQP